MIVAGEEEPQPSDIEPTGDRVTDGALIVFDSLRYVVLTSLSGHSTRHSPIFGIQQHSTHLSWLVQLSVPLRRSILLFSQFSFHHPLQTRILRLVDARH